MAEASSGREALQMMQKRPPDVVLLDLAMPNANGMDVLTALDQSTSRSKVILLTAGIERTQIVRALELGARAIVLKHSASEQLFEAIDTVLEGRLWMGNHSAADLAEALQRVNPSSGGKNADKGYGLTAREMEIIALVANGDTNNDIARKLSIRERTVKNHLVTVFIKLGVSNRVELARFASERGLIRL